MPRPAIRHLRTSPGYRLGAIIDASQQVPELREDNNTWVGPSVVVTVQNAVPDLRVVAVNPPSDGYSGKQINVSWTVENFGQLPASGNWVDRLWLSTDNQLSGDDIQVVSPTHTGPLAPGDQYTATATVTLPNSIDGPRFILVKTDVNNSVYEGITGGEDNNFGVGGFASHLTPPPDLQVTSIVPPPEGWSGRGIDVAWTVANNGSGPAEGNWIDRVWLRRDGTTGSDTYLGELARPANLQVGDSYTRRQTFTLPAGISGSYRVVVTTDAGNTLYEHTPAAESNNTTVSDAFSVHLTPYADLQVTAVDVPPTATAGQQATFSWTVTNAGNGATDAASWSDRVYLSTNRSLDASDVSIGTAQNPSYLAPGESYSQSLTATVPASLTGQYYAIVVTDSGNSQYEYLYENNNTTASALPVQIEPAPAPGFLHVSSVTVSPAPPSTIWSGQPVTVNWTVTNTGSSPISGSYNGDEWDDALALSPTPNWDGVHGYWFGGHFWHSGTLDVGASYSNQGTITLPANLFGTWYVVPVVDTHYLANGNGAVGSGNVPRDQGSAAIQITLPPAPDLQVTSVTAPAAGVAGQPIGISWTVTNEGFGPTSVTSWADSVYLSTDQTLQRSGSGADALLGTFTHTGSLAAIDGYTQTANVTLPSGISGPYYVFVVTDSGNAVFEHADAYDAEANNAGFDATPVAVTLVPPPPPPPLPDLQVSSVTPPTGAASGQTVTVGWTVVNGGPGATGVSSWSDRIVLSADNSLATTGDNWTLGSFGHSGVLAAAASNVQKCLDVDMEGVVVVATSEQTRNLLVRALPCHRNCAVLTGAEAISRFTMQQPGAHPSVL